MGIRGVIIKRTEKMKKILTLCIPHKNKKILLGLKKRGFGVGRWNGFGGKIKTGETVEEAARRELYEEARIQGSALESFGILDFKFKGESEELEIHVFKTRDWEGSPMESEEMMPRWFSVYSIPYKEMWPDDTHWLPLFLAEKKFKGRFLFDGMDTILKKEVTELK